MGARSEVLVDAVALRLVSFSLKPGEEVGAHSSPADIILVARAGRGEILVGERWEAVGAGDWRHVQPRQAHGFRAGAEGLELLAAMVPGISGATTVDEVQKRLAGATAALNRLGIDTCCGGGESLEAAAQRAGVDSMRVLDALKAGDRVPRPAGRAWTWPGGPRRGPRAQSASTPTTGAGRPDEGRPAPAGRLHEVVPSCVV